MLTVYNLIKLINSVTYFTFPRNYLNDLSQSSHGNFLKVKFFFFQPYRKQHYVMYVTLLWPSKSFETCLFRTSWRQARSFTTSWSSALNYLCEAIDTGFSLNWMQENGHFCHICGCYWIWLNRLTISFFGILNYFFELWNPRHPIQKV